MKIDEVITLAIVALYTSPRLSKLLVLKGGGAMRLFDGLDARLSIDADFSVEGVIQNDTPSSKRWANVLWQRSGSKAMT